MAEVVERRGLDNGSYWIHQRTGEKYKKACSEAAEAAEAAEAVEAVAPIVNVEKSCK